jgi:hypothetical protein
MSREQNFNFTIGRNGVSVIENRTNFLKLMRVLRPVEIIAGWFSSDIAIPYPSFSGSSQPTKMKKKRVTLFLHSQLLFQALFQAQF